MFGSRLLIRPHRFDTDVKPEFRRVGYVNRCVELLKQGQPVYYDRVAVTDLGYEAGRDLSTTWADFLRIEFEHQALDGLELYEFMRGLRDVGPRSYKS